MTSNQQRAALQRQIWQIANDVRGAVDGWDFKQYVLGTLFYRFISENFASYIVLISKDENLTKSHARYVEACLIRSTGSNPRWSHPNSKLPAGDAGKLPLPDRAAMDEFVDQTRTLVGALGWDLFREMRGRTADPATIAPSVPSLTPSPGPRFFFRGAGFAAEMELGASGDFVALAGSRARVDTATTIPRGTSALRKTLLDSGVLKQEEDFLVFTSDYSFSSASAAAAAICGSSVNGRNSWKLPDGRTYADWEADQGEAPETPNSSMNSESMGSDQ